MRTITKLIFGSGLLAVMTTSDVAAQPALATTTTTYRYNTDGALTAITTQDDEQDSETTYITWDDFLPNAADPTTGTIMQGNGRMLGYGPSPGSFVEQFQFDLRDRLVGYSGNGQTVAYDFHPTQMLASATHDGSSPWRFYYDTNEHPQVTNIYEQDSDLWSSYLDRTRYVSDGGEQTLLQPRKDVACLYEPQTDAVTPYRFDPFGGRQDPPPGSYELSENPFQYTNEFRDPVWGGYYLRARWYHPDLPSFLTRDPRSDQVNRFAYAGGNPEMNTDPGGMLHSLGWGLKKLNNIPGLGDVARIAFGPALSIFELAAHPKGFARTIAQNKAGNDYFLFGGILASITIPAITNTDAAGLRLAQIGLGKRFGGVLLGDLLFGATQTVMNAGLARGTHHWNWETFRQGMEYTVGGIAWARLGAGVGYSPYKLRPATLEDFSKDIPFEAEGSAKIFRERFDGKSDVGTSFRGRQTSPWQERFNLGQYHERVIAITQEGKVFFNEFYEGIEHGVEVSLSKYLAEAGERRSEFAYVGVKKNFNAAVFRNLNPRSLPTRYEYNSGNFMDGSTRYNRYTNNCQYHAAAVRTALGL